MNEDQLGAALRRWGDEVAPDVAVDVSVVPGRARRRRVRARVVGAVSSVLVLGLGTMTVAAMLERARDQQLADAPLECPASVPADDHWVPAAATFADAVVMLTPPDAVEGVVCGFEPKSQPEASWTTTSDDPALPSYALREVRTLDAEVAGDVAAFLASVPPSMGNECTLITVSETSLLVGLRSADDTTTWTRVEPGCGGLTNGLFSTGIDGYVVVAGLLDTGTVPQRREDTDPCFPGWGRRDQWSELVPAGATAVTVCDTATAAVATSDEPAVVLSLRETFTGLERGASNGLCTVAPGVALGSPYVVRFHYPTGPDATVEARSGCQPGVSFLGRGATATPELFALLAEMTG